MKPGWHKYIIYISLIFLVIALYKAQYLVVPRFHSPFLLIISLLCLFGGFIVNAVSQQRLLARADLGITHHQAIAMTGLNVFGKYIPGKVWLVMGKALYIAEKNNYPVADLSFLFLNAQLIGLWSGMALGICGLLTNDAFRLLNWAGLALFTAFTLVLFWDRAHTAGLRAFNRFFRKDLTLPLLGFPATLSLLPWFLAVWVLWGIGFYFLAQSLTDQIIPMASVYCFPLAGTLGILFVVAPGGIGVRESIITGYLSMLDVPLPVAITISAVSRFWFLIGELFIFAAGYAANKKT